MKIYARQVNPEYQESPILDCLPEDIALFGNRDYNEHMPDAVRRVRGVLEVGNLAEALEDIESGRTNPVFQFTSPAEALFDAFPQETRTGYTPEEVKSLCLAVKEWENDERNALCRVLSVVTGFEWNWRTICGCCQGDWQDVYFIKAHWSREALDVFGVEYFNTGSEWIVQDDGETPEAPEDVEGYSLYCIGATEDEIRREIADAAGCTPEDVVMYKWAGVRRVDLFEEV